MKQLAAFAPGRVNLIGEHTDYTGGLVLPMALDVGITVSGERGGDEIRLVSTTETEAVVLGLNGKPLVGTGPVSGWGKYIAGVVKQLRPSEGFVGEVSSTMPTGGTGLSTSSALSCATLLALGAEGDPIDIARMAQRAEISATGVEIGLMDQIASMCGVAQHAIRIDCRSFDVEPVAIPGDLEVLVVHSGQPRMLADSEYSARHASCVQIERLIGPLRDATVGDVERLDDPVLVRRGTHIVQENQRVVAMIAALRADDIPLVAEILNEGHASLSTLFEISTPIVDDMVASLLAVPGIYGARMTGGGFGGCIVVLAEPGTTLDTQNWWMRASAGSGARLL